MENQLESALTIERLPFASNGIVFIVFSHGISASIFKANAESYYY